MNTTSTFFFFAYNILFYTALIVLDTHDMNVVEVTEQAFLGLLNVLQHWEIVLRSRPATEANVCVDPSLAWICYFIYLFLRPWPKYKE